MANDNETLVKEAIRKAVEEAENVSETDETVSDGAGSGTDEQMPDEGTGDTGADGGDPDDEVMPDEETDDSGKELADKKESKKSGLFGKKNRKDPRDEKIEELNDRLLRNLAEFENFRKRTEKEKSQMFEIGAKSIIEKILPSIDSFERGLGSLSEADRSSPVAEGMEKIYRQLVTGLEDAGLKTIEAVGKEFDPNLHNAVMHEENEELGENIVSEELQKGYMYHDSVVRHSMVKVAN